MYLVPMTLFTSEVKDKIVDYVCQSNARNVRHILRIGTLLRSVNSEKMAEATYFTLIKSLFPRLYHTHIHTTHESHFLRLVQALRQRADAKVRARIYKHLADDDMDMLVWESCVAGTPFLLESALLCLGSSATRAKITVTHPNRARNEFMDYDASNEIYQGFDANAQTTLKEAYEFQENLQKERNKKMQELGEADSQCYDSDHLLSDPFDNYTDIFIKANNLSLGEGPSVNVCDFTHRELQGFEIPESFVCQRQHYTIETTALQEACLGGHSDCVRLLFKHHDRETLVRQTMSQKHEFEHDAVKCAAMSCLDAKTFDLVLGSVASTYEANADKLGLTDWRGNDLMSAFEVAAVCQNVHAVESMLRLCDIDEPTRRRAFRLVCRMDIAGAYEDRHTTSKMIELTRVEGTHIDELTHGEVAPGLVDLRKVLFHSPYPHHCVANHLDSTILA